MPGLSVYQGFKYAIILNMPWFWICQGSEYSRNLNTPGFWMYQGSEYNRVLNIPRFWIYQGSKYVRVLSMRSFLMYQGSVYTGVIQTFECFLISLDNSWICLIMSKYARMLNTNWLYCDRSRWGRNLANLKKRAKKNLHYFHKALFVDVWEGCEYTCGPKYTRVLNGALVLYAKVLDILGSWIWVWFWICQGSEYTIILNISGFQIYQGSTGFSMCLNIPAPEFRLIIYEYAWIYQHICQYC